MKKTPLEKALQGRFRDIGDRIAELSSLDREALLVEHLEWLEVWQEEEILFLPYVFCQPQKRKRGRPQKMVFIRYLKVND